MEGFSHRGLDYEGLTEEEMRRKWEESFPDPLEEVYNFGSSIVNAGANMTSLMAELLRAGGLYDVESVIEGIPDYRPTLEELNLPGTYEWAMNEVGADPYAPESLVGSMLDGPSMAVLGPAMRQALYAGTKTLPKWAEWMRDNPRYEFDLSSEFWREGPLSTDEKINLRMLDEQEYLQNRPPPGPGTPETFRGGYHGTGAEYVGDDFRDPLEGTKPLYPALGLGTHGAGHDPQIANAFANDRGLDADHIKPGGHVIPMIRPDDSWMYHVPQKPFSSGPVKAGSINKVLANDDISVKWAMEHFAFKHDRDVLRKALINMIDQSTIQAWERGMTRSTPSKYSPGPVEQRQLEDIITRLQNGEASPLPKAVQRRWEDLRGKDVTLEDLMSDSNLRDMMAYYPTQIDPKKSSPEDVKAFEEFVRAARRGMAKEGYKGVEYINTAPHETYGDPDLRGNSYRSDTEAVDPRSFIALGTEDISPWFSGKARTGTGQGIPLRNGKLKLNAEMKAESDGYGHGDWLEQQRARDLNNERKPGWKMDDDPPYKELGETTQVARGVAIPVEKLKPLRGLNQEQADPNKEGLVWQRGNVKFDKGKVMVARMTDDGSDITYVEERPWIKVDKDGKAWIANGNHRIMEAIRRKEPYIYVTVDWHLGGDRETAHGWDLKSIRNLEF